MYTYGSKMQKYEKKHEIQPFELMLVGRSQGGRSQGESEKQKGAFAKKSKFFFRKLLP